MADPLHVAQKQGHMAPDLILVTGLSGAGRSTALKMLEDLGYESVDNLPAALTQRVMMGAQTDHPLAIGMDSRTRGFSTQSVQQLFARARAQGLRPFLLYLSCDDDILVRRFVETRRRHPLAEDRAITDGIQHERDLMAPVQRQADLVIDTSFLTPADLKSQLRGYFSLRSSQGLVLTVMSFSYRAGLPREADLVFDTRFLRNPHYDPALQPLTGQIPAVADYVKDDPAFAPFFDDLTRMIGRLLPGFAKEGKTYLTIAIGCTGGKHRSVAVAEHLAAWLRDQGYDPRLRHRDIPDGATDFEPPHGQREQ